MNWTTTEDIRQQLMRLWDRGLIAAAVINKEPFFPRRLALRKPSSSDLSERFDDVRRWISDLRQDRHYRLVMRELRHKVIGTNLLPDEIWVDTLEDALSTIDKKRDAAKLENLAELFRNRRPDMLVWLSKRPLKAIELSDDLPLILDIAVWITAHPRPGIYLRQLDLPGIHTKFIETHRAVLSEMLDILLSHDELDTEASGITGFCRRYGFLDKPQRVRFRILDPKIPLIQTATDQDITVTQETFNRLDAKVRRVFITENEVNFLAFPEIREGMAIFGSGYGFDMLEDAGWLRDCSIHYWGDIDTHGFAILDQLRSIFPDAESFLMDRATLMAHKGLWVKEPRPTDRELSRLNQEERLLFDDLRYDRLGVSVRLEQERIGYGYIMQALEQLKKPAAQW